MRPRIPSAALEGLFLAPLVFGPFAFGCVEPWSKAALEILIFFGALACFLRGRAASSRLGAYAWLFPAGVALLGFFQALRPALPDGPWFFGPISVAPHETGASALLWLSYAALLYSAPRVIISPAAARRYARTLFGVGLAAAVLGLLQAATSEHLIYWVRETMPAVPFGPYYNRDHAANLFLMSLAVGGGLFASFLGRWNPTDGPLPGYWRSLGLLAAGLILFFFCIVFCQSRGALLAMPLAIAVLGLAGSGFVQDSRNRSAATLAALAGLSLVVFFAFAHVEAGERAGAAMDWSVSSRLAIYSNCWRWLKDAPFFGTGLGSFDSVYPAYQDEGLRYVVSHAHSDWLEFCLEAGLLGGLAALAAAALMLALSVRIWIKARSREMRALIAGALAAFVAFAAHSLFEFSFQIPANAAVFFSIAGFLVSAPSWADKTPHPARSRPEGPLPAAAALAACILACWTAMAPEAALLRVAQAKTEGQRRAALRGAFAIDDDPLYLRELALSAYRSAGGGINELAALRDGLSCALEALPRRPFDPQALYLAGAILWRLQRRSDAQALLERQDLVSFSPVGSGAAPPDEDRRRLEELRRLGLIHQKGPVR